MASKIILFAALAVSCAVALPGHAVDYYVRLKSRKSVFVEKLKRVFGKI